MCRVGYLDQHTALAKGMTIRDALAGAFDFLFEMEARMNEICEQMGDAGEEELNAYMEELGTIQELLTAHDFYLIDSKIEEVARALGLLELGLDKDVTDLSGGQRTKILLAKLLLEKPDILLLDEPTSAVDVETEREIQEALREVSHNRTVITIAHRLNTIADADEI